MNIPKQTFFWSNAPIIPSKFHILRQNIGYGELFHCAYLCIYTYTYRIRREPNSAAMSTAGTAGLYRRVLPSPPAIDFASSEGKVCLRVLYSIF